MADGYAEEGSSELSKRMCKFVHSSKGTDDESDAFQELRRHVIHNAESGTRCLNGGVRAQTMAAFLQRLNDFGGRKKIQLRRIDEVLIALATSADGFWSAQIKDARGKLSNLPKGLVPGCRALVGACADDSLQGKCVKLVTKDMDGQWEVELSGTRYHVSESCLKAVGDDGHSYLQDLSFSKEDTPEHLLLLHEGLKELLSLLCFAEKDVDTRARLNQITVSYSKGWQEILADKDLHYVFGGLVSSGKTTLVNRCLAHVCANQGSQAGWAGEMLPTNALENTAAVTMFALGRKHCDKIIVRSEHVRFTESSDDCAAKFKSEADPKRGVSELETMQQLQGRMPTLLEQLTRTAHGFRRLIVEIPYTLKVLNEADFISSVVPSEVFVDSPGLDSPGIKYHLVSVLDQKCFIFCFLVDVTSPSPFGNHGFEVLQFLTQKSDMMFPPVIVFTKWELMKEQATLRTWKKANPKGLDDRVRNLVSTLLDKMEAAGIPYTPFFASVNALLAGDQDCDVDDEEVQVATEGLSCFTRDLMKLGRNIANPVHQCRMLQLQTQTTQEIINLIHQKDGEVLLAADDISGMKQIGQTLKERFRADVESYFQHIVWSSYGLASFKPRAPFNRETCAITQIPNDFEDVFQQYKNGHERMRSKATAVQEVVEQTLLKVQSNIVMNLSTYEARAIEKFREHLWKKVGMKGDDFKKHLDFSFWQYAVGAGLGAGSILAGVTAGEFAFVSGVSASTYFTGAAFCVGASVAAGGLLLMTAWWAKDEIGGWTWEGAKQASWDAVMEACQKNSAKIQKHVTTTFNTKVDEIIKKVEEHRIVPSPEASQSKAEQIHHQTKRGYKDVAKRLNDVLQSRKDRWLGTPCELKQICEEALRQREPMQSMERNIRMPLD